MDYIPLPSPPSRWFHFFVLHPAPRPATQRSACLLALVPWPSFSIAMKTQVTFQADMFPPYDGEEERMNPEVWGQRLAEYLVAALAKKGIETETPIAEDWGCGSFC